MGRLFGTDGVRGVANRQLTAHLALQLGEAAGTILREEKGAKPTVFVGRDTRLSSQMLQAAISAGLTAAGCDAVELGVLPTAAVSYLVVQKGADAGVMITASHNPFEDNGIKIVGTGGLKLSDREIDEIEAILLDGHRGVALADPAEVGRILPGGQYLEDYIRMVTDTAGHLPRRLRVAFDCANGAASATAPVIFGALGCDATYFFNDPDGLNVNRGCGSTHMEVLQRQVREGGFDLGIAFDGDADRMLAVDAAGQLVDGDQLMALFAADMAAAGRLPGGKLAVTVLSNLGLHRFAEENGLALAVTPVGDRYVMERMEAEGIALGGEQSGHIIFREILPTGDGQLTAARLLAVLAGSSKPLAALAGCMQHYPQVMVNARVPDLVKYTLAEEPAVRQAIREAEQRLSGGGRVLVRPSGTEPLVRVMVEGADGDEIARIAQALAGVIEELAAGFHGLEAAQ